MIFNLKRFCRAIRTGVILTLGDGSLLVSTFHSPKIQHGIVSFNKRCSKNRSLSESVSYDEVGKGLATMYFNNVSALDRFINHLKSFENEWFDSMTIDEALKLYDEGVILLINNGRVVGVDKELA